MTEYFYTNTTCFKIIWKPFIKSKDNHFLKFNYLTHILCLKPLIRIIGYDLNYLYTNKQIMINKSFDFFCTKDKISPHNPMTLYII